MSFYALNLWIHCCSYISSRIHRRTHLHALVNEGGCAYIYIFFFFLTSIHIPLLPTWPSITGWDWFYSVLLRVWAQCVKLKLQEQLSGPKQRRVTHHKRGGRCPSGSRPQRWLPHTCMPPCHWAGHWAVPAPGPRTGPATGAQHLQTPPRVKHRQGELLGFISKWSTCFATASHHPPAPYALPVFSSNPDLQKQNSNFMPVHRELLAFSRLQDLDAPPSHQLQTCCHTFCLCPELSLQNTNFLSSLSDCKISFQKPTTASRFTSEISPYIRGWFSFLNYCCM